MSATFTNELVLRLIEAYKNYELLWDTGNRDSKDRSKKNAAWDDIAKTINMPRREVESKIHTLRSQFAREKKKIALLKQHGRYDNYTSWFAYEPMKFLLKLDDGLDSDMQNHQNSDDKYPDPEPFHTENFLFAAPTQYETTGTTTPPTSYKSHNNCRKRTISYEDKSDGDITAYSFAKHLEQTTSQKAINDEFDIYAQYVASELRETKDLHSVLVAKHHINNILFNARMGKYRRTSVHGNSGIKYEYDVNVLDMSNHGDGD